ncbi:MAG TPA: DUF3352 domain-containing protein [Thermomicrobiales bacterium]|nr:DUF3352 domain-containing protein [Thermomicrobiales bacterium]
MQSRTHTLTVGFSVAHWMMLLVAFALVSALIVPLAPASAQTFVTNEPVDIVPETAYVYVEANLDTSTEQGALAADLLQRAGLADLLEEEAGTDEIPEGLHVAFVLTSIPDLEALDEVGDVTTDPMAVTKSFDGGGFAVIVSSEGSEQFIADERARMEADTGAGLGEITEAEHGGVTITAFEPSDAFAEGTAVATIGDYRVFAMRAEDLHPLIDTFNEDLTSLASSERYQLLTDLLPSEHVASGWINGVALLEAVEASSPEAIASVDVNTLAALDAWTAFTFSAEPQGFRLETRSLPNELVESEPVALDGAFLDTVPADAVFVTTGTDIDSSGLVTLLAFLFATELVGEDLMATPVDQVDVAQAQNDVFERSESLLGFNIKTDFIDNLTGRYGIFVSVDDITAETPAIDALIVSDITNPVVVQDVMSKISFIAGAALGDQGSIETRDVDGSQVYQIALSEDTAGIDSKIEFGVIDDEVVISVGSGLDDYLTGPAQPLSQDETFETLMARLPDEYNHLTYIDLHQVVTMATELSEGQDFALEDADPACAEFASQAEAQAAYDEDPFTNFLLDLDFDGEACEDYPFAGATPSASPVVQEDRFANIHGLATVMYEEGDVEASSTFILIDGE